MSDDIIDGLFSAAIRRLCRAQNLNLIKSLLMFFIRLINISGVLNVCIFVFYPPI